MPSPLPSPQEPLAGAVTEALTMPRLLAAHRLRLGAGLLCLVLLALTGAAYAFLTGPVLRLLLGGGTSPDLPMPRLSALLDLAGSRGTPLSIALLLVGLALLKGLAHLGQAVLIDGTAERVGLALRVRLYEHLIRLPLAAHRQRSPGDCLARLIDDVRRVQEAAVLAPLVLLREGLAVMALLGVALWMAPWLALAALLALPLAGLVIGVMGRRVKRAAERGQDHLGVLASRASQGLGAIREVKSCGAEGREVAAVERQGRHLLDWALRGIRAQATAPLLNEVMAAAGLGLVIVLAAGRWTPGALPPERLVSFFAAVLMMYRPIKELGRAAHRIAAGRASLDRVDALLQSPAEAPAHGTGLPPLRRRLRLSGVGFGYGQGRWAIRGVDLDLEVGKVVAITGPSGAGKSTLGNLVCGLERPQEGRVFWDGVDLQDRPLAQLRARVALVPQQPLLLEGTLADNLRYGAPEASEAELHQALDAVGLVACVQGQPRGAETRIGPGGVQLSVGEAQRLAMARALLRRASLLVLDEPTSALDPESEALLLRTIRLASQERAVLLIAHHSVLLTAADLVLTLEEGQISPAAPPP